MPSPQRWLLGGLAALGLVLLVFWAGPWLLTRGLDDELNAEQVLKAENDVRSTLVQAVAGLAVASGAIVTYRTFRRTRVEQDRNYALNRSHLVTEAYAKAVEQLGHGEGPVRLGAMYSLERLAQDNPELRQTVVDVLCAYLRMTYAPPDGSVSATVQRNGVSEGLAGPASSRPSDDDPAEELQVRQTGQRLLTGHLRSPPETSGPEAQGITASEDQRFWPGISLDLTGAALIGFEPTDMSVVRARFDGAHFVGDALFGRAAFSGDTSFNGTIFTGTASFGGATFADTVSFGRARFIGDALFRGATFAGTVSFGGASFRGNSRFEEATFSGGAVFVGAEFSGTALFDEARFSGTASFGRARFLTAKFRRVTFAGDIALFGRAAFSGDAWFEEASFSGDAQFGGATFGGIASFARANFARTTQFGEAHFSGESAWFGRAIFSGSALFGGAVFARTAQFGAAEFRGPASFAGVTFPATASFEKATFSDTPSFERARILRLGAPGPNKRAAEARGQWPDGWTVRWEAGEPTSGTLVPVTGEQSLPDAPLPA